MQKVTFQELVERIVERDPRYQPGAYLFVREARVLVRLVPRVTP